jgi:outer membrane protein OmpA-like peptidoglycan-associated protein
MGLRSFLAAVLLSACALGCSTPGAQLSQCQSEKEQLLATIRDQRDANRQMHDRLASLESRLDESEKELARAGQPGTRLSSVGSAVHGVPSTTRGTPAIKTDSNLAWKSPPKAAGSTKPGSSSTSPGSLAQIAASDKRLKLDPQARTAELDVPIAFEDNSASLSADAKRQLDGVATLLKSKEAADLKVLVSGFAEGRPPKSGENAFTSARQLAAARAQAVADYLDRHGIAEERLAVSGAGSRVAAESGASKQAASGVQILVAERDAPVVGWGGSGGTIRR